MAAQDDDRGACYPFSHMNETQFVIAAQSIVFATPWMLSVAILCARWLIFVNLFLGAWLLKSRRPQDRHAVLEAAWGVALALIITSILSHLIGRERPFLAGPARLAPGPIAVQYVISIRPYGHGRRHRLRVVVRK